MRITGSLRKNVTTLTKGCLFSKSQTRCPLYGV